MKLIIIWCRLLKDNHGLVLLVYSVNKDTKPQFVMRQLLFIITTSVSPTFELSTVVSTVWFHQLSPSWERFSTLKLNQGSVTGRGVDRGGLGGAEAPPPPKCRKGGPDV